MSSGALAASGSPRVLIARLSAIGDTIHGMPVLCALRERFPRAFLAWVVEEKAAVLLRGHRALDELITLPRGWLKSPKTVWGLFRRLRKLKFDVAVDLQGLTKSSLVAWLSGARRRIGFGDDKGRELSRWLNNALVSTAVDHVVDCYLALLEPLGIRRPTVRFQVPEAETDAAAARRMIAGAGVESGFAVINPGAGWPSRIWPADRHAAVARFLGSAWRLPSMVVWAGEDENGMAQRIVAGSAGHARLAPPTALTELASLLRLTRICISSDTGPLHLAAAVGTPCVSLHGSTWAQRSGPYGRQHIPLQKRALDDPLHHNRRSVSTELIEAISIGMVCEACDRILRRRGAETAA